MWWNLCNVAFLDLARSHNQYLSVFPNHHVQLCSVNYNDLQRYLSFSVCAGNSEIICLPVFWLHSRAESLVDKFEEGRGTNYIDEAIVLDRKALELCSPSHPARSRSLTLLGIHLSDRYNQLGGITDIEEAIVVDREALVLRPPGHPDRPSSLSNLAVDLFTRYKQLGGMEDLDEAIVLDREALALHPPRHPDLSVLLNNNLALHLTTRYEQLGGMEDLTEAIQVGRDTLALCPPRHEDHSTSLSSLADQLSTRYNRLGGMEDLNEAIVLGRDALALHPPGHEDRSGSLNNLAVNLSTPYKQLGGMEDLEEAIVLDREALALCPPGHPDHSMSLNNFAVDLSTRYQQLGGMEDLNEAILLGRDALALHPHGDPDRSALLNNLALHLSTRYKQLGGMEDLDEAIVLDREALALYPPGYPDRSTSLNNLGAHLSTRYDELGGMEDLNEAILLDRDALALCPPGHPNRSMSLSNLAVYLSSRYKQLGRMEDLDEAILLGRDALALFPPEHPNRSISLNNFAADLSTRYKQLGGMEDLNDAIVLNREALALCPLGHPDRSTTLDNLASGLCTRYNQLGGMEDLNEAILLSRDALALRPPGHLNRLKSLNSLAVSLSTRYNKLRGMEDLNGAIVLNHEALALCPLGHEDRSNSLNNLAVDLITRYNEYGGMEDLNEAILLNRDALALRPPGHRDRSSSLNNLALNLSTRYDQLGGMEDLDEAILLGRDTLALSPPGHPDRSGSLNNLAGHLHTRFTKLNQLKDKDDLFSLLAQLAHVPQVVSSVDLSVARTWIDLAEHFHHPETVLAYETSLLLLTHHVATLPPLPQHRSVLKGITSSLAVDAFSACLRNQSPTGAVELLEQGRGVFWSQLTRLRSPLDDVIASSSAGKELIDEFIQRTSLIRTALDSPGPGQHDRVCRLNVELQGVVARIRELPGLSRFLLPPLFSNLQQAARDGPIIIVNASKYGCDALVVLVDRNPQHIPLSITKDGVRELTLKLATLSERTLFGVVTADLLIILRALWHKVVSPIANFLQTVHPLQSRIWWCPTAEFSLLPLHAAGPHEEGQKNLANLYISSYTPTLTALIRARQLDLPHAASKGKHFIGIGQANAEGENEIASVGPELANIRERVNGLTTFTHIQGPDSCISRVAEELGKNEWVHFACHGIPDQEEPFESAFALRDGHFTIERIIQCELRNAEFAFLSACQTTVGDEESPDEVIHLASAMQFAGFRSVIGTMWAVLDNVTPMITSRFYKNMIDECGGLDHTRAALALNKTIEESVDIPFDLLFLYIHIGA